MSLRIKVYYYKRGYRETEVDTLVTRAHPHTNHVRVTFKITEGKPVIVDSLVVLRPSDTVLTRKTHSAHGAACTWDSRSTSWTSTRRTCGCAMRSGTRATRTRSSRTRSWCTTARARPR